MEWFHRAVDYGIIGILVAMSIVAVAIAIERFYCFSLSAVTHALAGNGGAEVGGVCMPT